MLTVDAVNVLKGLLWNDKSEFDESKDKTQFRQYEEACDRVKEFYKEQHGERSARITSDDLIKLTVTREADRGFQHQMPSRLQKQAAGSHERVGGDRDA